MTHFIDHTGLPPCGASGASEESPLRLTGRLDRVTCTECLGHQKVDGTEDS